MKPVRAALFYLMLAGLAPAAAAHSPPSPVAAQGPVVLGARIGQHPEYTRIVLEISDPVKARVFTLANPDRVVIELPKALWGMRPPERPYGGRLVKSYRFGLFRRGESRFILDLNAPAKPKPPLILPPAGGAGFRLVIDLYPTTEGQFLRSAGWPADLLDRPPPPAAVAALREDETGLPKKKVVVLDAGHGGIDAGATGVDGTREKDVVLDEARRLARVLERRGYIVRLTRSGDTYVPLRRRVGIARGYDADLFISLHADSNPDAGLSGASVYTLSERGSDREAADLARKENASDVLAGVDLKGQDETVSHILIDLTQRETIDRSARFAQILVRQLGTSIGVIGRDPHRSAAFVVLKAPDVPAVLVELGYLSNARDCQRMGSAAWRDAAANSIAAAVDRQFAPELAGASIAIR